tara:strand:- start:881 stop:1519 length:639 start_codon:yes stop_codon:yes gene_type:complete
MNESFELIRNLPLIVFGVGFTINFFLFVWAITILLKGKGNVTEIERGRKKLTNAFVVLFLVLLAMGVFYLITFLVRRGEAFEPSQEISEEFPPPSKGIANFPPEPKFITIEGLHFTGPFEFDPNQRIKDPAMIAVLCKEQEEHDVLYVGSTNTDFLQKYEQYSCWMENCLDNLQIAILYTPIDTFDASIKLEVEKKLNNIINPPCSTEVQDI